MGLFFFKVSLQKHPNGHSHISDVSDVGNVGDDGEKLFWLLWAISDHFSLLYDFVHFGQFCGHFCYDELMMN